MKALHGRPLPCKHSSRKLNRAISHSGLISLLLSTNQFYIVLKLLLKMSLFTIDRKSDFKSREMALLLISTPNIRGDSLKVGSLARVILTPNPY